jgi:hypothetical protein
MFDIRYQHALHTTSFKEQPISKNSLTNFRAAVYRYNQEHGIDLVQKEECKRVWKYLKENNIYTLLGWENEFSGLDNQFIRFNIGEQWEMDRVVELLSEC